MNKNIKNIALALTIPLVMSSSFASDEGLYVLGGVGLGFTGTAEESNVLNDRTGTHLEIKGSLSYYRPEVIIDLGLGWFMNETSDADYTVQTKSAFLEGSLRYRINKNWNIGPVLTSAFNNDNSFSINNAGDTNESFIGLRLEFEPDYFKVNKVRINATVQRDFTIENRAVTTAVIGFQFGIPFADQSVKEKIVYKTKYVPRIVKTSRNSIKATFDASAGYNFKTGSSVANTKMLKYIKRLGYFLKKYSNEYKHLKIVGHTDNTGSVSKNMKLSKKRAFRVKKLLVQEGVSKKKMTAKWFGPHRPLDKANTLEAREKNRRFELEFIGLKNADEFFAGLSIIE